MEQGRYLVAKGSSDVVARRFKRNSWHVRVSCTLAKSMDGTGRGEFPVIAR